MKLAKSRSGNLLMSTTITRKYYKGRLWKITTVVVPLNKYGTRCRFVKHYERRDAIGEPWQYINHATVENFKP